MNVELVPSARLRRTRPPIRGVADGGRAGREAFSHSLALSERDDEGVEVNAFERGGSARERREPRTEDTHGEMRKPGRQNQIPEAVGVRSRGGIWTWKMRLRVLVCTAR